MKNSQDFYKKLLAEAILKMDPESSMVAGPLFSCGDLQKNIKSIESKIFELRESGLVVFNQIPYLDDNLKDAPHDYDEKFKIFYKGLLTSKKITKLHVLPGYEKSKGTVKEINFAKAENIPIIYITKK